MYVNAYKCQGGGHSVAIVKCLASGQRIAWISGPGSHAVFMLEIYVLFYTLGKDSWHEPFLSNVLLSSTTIIFRIGKQNFKFAINMSYLISSQQLIYMKRFSP